MSSDNWRPSATLDNLKARAALLARLRAFFMQVGVMEVETPLLSRHANTDPAIESMQSRYLGPGEPNGLQLSLHTSPEFPMKRLLAAASGPIYQICKVFRDGEAGRLHNPEFTLLEWYRPGFDHHQLMDEMAEMLHRVLEKPLPVERVSYRELFLQHLNVDPLNSDQDQLRTVAVERRVPGADSLDLDGKEPWLDLLLTHCIEHKLGRGRMTFVYDYPASQASLARLRHDEESSVAERFELYLEGMEIANGFHELSDAAEQRRRFEQDNHKRLEMGLTEQKIDENLLAALEAGFPDCAGVALGVDRLLMVMSGAQSISEVLAFPLDRA